MFEARLIWAGEERSGKDEKRPERQEAEVVGCPVSCAFPDVVDRQDVMVDDALEEVEEAPAHEQPLTTQATIAGRRTGSWKCGPGVGLAKETGLLSGRADLLLRRGECRQLPRPASDNLGVPRGSAPTHPSASSRLCSAFFARRAAWGVL
jgi:hypothetical protein